MAVDGGLISLDGSGRVCTQCHMMAPDQSRLTPNVFSDAVVSTIFGFDYSERRKVRTPKWKVSEKVCKRALTIGHIIGTRVFGGLVYLTFQGRFTRNFRILKSALLSSGLGQDHLSLAHLLLCTNV